VILLDANVVMYACGALHPHKAASAGLLTAVAEGRVSASCDVEVLQEILHRYRSVGRFDDALSVYSLARTVLGEPLAVDGRDLDRARDLLARDRVLTARDALHAAVFLRGDAELFCSYDADFDRIPGLVRVEPGQVLAGRTRGR